MAYDGSLIFDTKVDTKGFQKGSNTLKGQADGLMGTFKKLGGVIAGAFIVKKAFDIGKQAVSLASDVQEVQNVVDTAFGDMAYKIEDFSKTSIQNFGLSQLAAKKTASTYMAMAKGMQLPADVASDMSVKLTGLTGDMSSFYNVSQDVADTALKSIFTGETESLKQFGVVMTQTNLQQFAYSQGINQSIDTMSQAQLVQLRYNYVLQQTSLAQGDFAKTSGSWANQTRVLAEQWKQFLTILGAGLLKVLTPVVHALNSVMSQLISFAESASNALSGIFGDGKAEEDKAKSQKKVTASIQSSVSATDDLTGAQKSLGKAVKGNLAGFDELNVLSSGDTGTGSVGVGGAIAPVVSPTVDTSGFEKLSNSMSPAIDKIKSAFADLAEAVKPFAKNVGAGLKWFYENVLKPFGSWVANDVVPAFLKVLGKAITVLNDVIEALKPTAKWLWDSFLQPIASWTGGLIVDILNGVAKALGAIGDWIKNNKGAFTAITITIGAFFAVWEVATLGEFIINAGGVVGIVSKLTTAFKACTIAKIADKFETLAIIGLYIKDFAVAVASAVANFAIQTASVIANTVAKVANTVAQIAMTVATGAWNVICGIATVVTTAFGAAVAFLTSPIGIVIAIIGVLIAIVVLLITHWDDVKNVAIAVWTAIVDFIKTAVTAIGGFFTGLWEGIKAVFSAIGDFFVSIFKVVLENAIQNAQSIIKVATAVWDGVKAVFSAVGGFFAGVWEGIKAPFLSVANWFKDVFSKAWQAVKDVFSVGGKIFDGIKDGIVDVFLTVVNGLIGGINKVILIPFDGINGALKKIKDISIAGVKPFDGINTIPVPQIPKLATGAVIPPNSEFLAMLGDQKHGVNIEAPLSTMVEAFETALNKRGGQGNGNPIIIVLKVGTKEFARVCIDSINDLTRSTGQFELELV